MCAKIKRVYKEAKEKKFILCFYVPTQHRRSSRCSRTVREQHSNVHGFSAIFRWCLYSHFGSPNVTHTGARGRPSSSLYFHLSFIPFLFVIRNWRKTHLEGTHWCIVTHQYTPIFRSLSRSLSIAENIEIIKKFLVVAWIWFTFDYSVFEHLGVNSALKIFYFNFSLNHT